MKIYIFENKKGFFQVVSNRKKAHDFVSKSMRITYQTFARKLAKTNCFTFENYQNFMDVVWLKQYEIKRVNIQQPVFILYNQYRKNEVWHREIILLATSKKQVWEKYNELTKFGQQMSYSTFCLNLKKQQASEFEDFFRCVNYSASLNTHIYLELVELPVL